MTPWVLRLVLLNVVAFFIQQSSPEFTDRFAMVPALAFRQPWTFITYMFLHGGFGHIFFNMLTLFFFGPRVEDRLGGRAFLGLYFCSGIAGAMLSLVLSRYPIIGASAAVYGVLLAYAWFWPRNQLLIWGIIPIEARVMVVLLTGLSLFWGFGGIGGGGVAHFAHLGGFVGGWVFLKVLQRESGSEKFRRQVQAPAPKLETTSGAMDRWKKIKRDTLHEVNRDELDRILDKISASGIASLTPGEREFLDRFSSRH